MNIEEKMKEQSNYADIEEQPLLWTSRWKQILFLHLEFFRKLSQCFTSHFVVNRPKAKWKVALVLCNSFICQHNSYKKSELRSYLQMYSKHIGELGELENKKNEVVSSKSTNMFCGIFLYLSWMVRDVLNKVLLSLALRHCFFLNSEMTL